METKYMLIAAIVAFALANHPDPQVNDATDISILRTSREVIRCRAGVCTNAGRAKVLSFKNSRFPMPPDDDPQPEYRQPQAWEIVAQDDNWSQDAISVVREVAAQNPRKGLDVGALLYSLAKYESSGRITCRGAAGERGLIQLHPVHRRRVARCGFDYASEHDRLTFALREMIYPALDEGKSLYAALRPWTVRNKALAKYKEVTE